MKFLRLFALAFLINITGSNLIEAKISICGKNKHWNYKKAKCVPNSKKSNSQVAVINEPVNINPQEKLQLPAQNPMGSDSTTYAPQTFTPAPQFSGNGLIGNYFSGNQIATIHDPSGQNNQSYSFDQVQEILNYANNPQTPAGLVYIGSFMTYPECEDGMMCIQVMILTTLFGKLQNQQNNNAPQKSPNLRRFPPTNSIPDDQFFHVDDPNYSRNNVRFGIQTPTRSNPKMGGMRTAVMYQMSNNSGQNLSITFFNSQQQPSMQTLNTGSSTLIPSGVTTIQLGQNGKIKRIEPYTSYSIVADKAGNLSIQPNQLYF